MVNIPNVSTILSKFTEELPVKIPGITQLRTPEDLFRPISEAFGSLFKGIFGGEKSENKARTALAFQAIDAMQKAIQNGDIRTLIHWIKIFAGNLLKSRSIRLLLLSIHPKGQEPIGALWDHTNRILSDLKEGKDALTWGTTPTNDIGHLINAISDLVYYTTQPAGQQQVEVQTIRGTFLAALILLIARARWIPYDRPSFQAIRPEIEQFLGTSIKALVPTPATTVPPATSTPEKELPAPPTPPETTTATPTAPTINWKSLIVPAMIYYFSQQE